MKKTSLLFCCCIFAFGLLFAQPVPNWQHKKCAVVLTYDDAIPQQLVNAVPALDSLNLKATFYLTAFFAKDRLEEWKAVATKGHELGNHTLFHPCAGGSGREWVKPDYNMKGYTVQRMIDETRMTNVFLQALDGKTKRTFAFTCGDMKIGDSSFMGAMKDDFVAARAVRNEMHRIEQVDLYNVDCYVVNNHSAAEMIEWVKKAGETNSLLVILFHGVGGGNALNVSPAEHSKFLHYLKQHEQDLWITTMLDAAEYIKKYQATKK
jgi:sialate O-acetylesterase